MNDDFNYSRRETTTVDVGGVKMGSGYPVRVQSMTNTDTNDIEASAAQCLRIAQAGGEIVRLTAQGVREAQSIGLVRQRLREQGCNVPLVADIHFNPRAAYAAAQVTDKVRINPGNFVDPARTFKSLTYTPDEYAAELRHLHDALVPFIDLCRQHHTAVRLGVNHGSLSDRIMSRYGNTAAGMVESVMEFLRVFVEQHFLDVVISMKASNVVVMVEAVRRLVDAMDAEHMHFPLHLGVTEAGFGDDGRVKSAVGIGCLMAEGLGDTVRVSLSEAPEAEIPVARKLVDYMASREGHTPIAGTFSPGYNRLAPCRRYSTEVHGKIGGRKVPIVIAGCDSGILKPDFYSHELDKCGIDWVETVASCPIDELKKRLTSESVIIVSPDNVNVSGCIQAFTHRLTTAGIYTPVIAHVRYDDTQAELLQVKAGADLGTVMLNGQADGIWLEAPRFDRQDKLTAWAFAILQAARVRMSKTEFISCPSCGRTMFDLMTTVDKVKAATAHLTHLKIAVMGCVVNGPGEMADADYGYVGAARHKISLYKGKTCIEKNIPETEAIPRLVALIKQNGDWVDP